MFPPVSGKEMDPPEPPALEPEDDYPGGYPPPPMSRYSQRFRILAFGLLVGGFIAVLYASAIALLRLIAGPEYPEVWDRWDRFRTAGERFFSVFASELMRSAPLWILIAVLAAAAQFLVRRTHQEARLTRDLIRTLVARASRPPRSDPKPTERTAADIVRPLRRELNMELDAGPETNP
jgi:hypothetical protein